VKQPIPSIIPIRAAVLREPGAPLEIESLEMEGPRDDELLVRIVASGICHTDIDFCEGGASGPVVLGHEGAGVLEQVGRKIGAITGGGVDYVVESTADGAMERLAVDLLNPGGKAALLSGARRPSQLPDRREVLSVIQGDAVPQKFIPRLIRLFRGGRFPFDRLVRSYDFANINQAIADSKCGRTIKPVLLMSAQVSLRTGRRVTNHPRERRSDYE
jgi:Zn-dependent alcohol dehydrogenase